MKVIFGDLEINKELEKFKDVNCKISNILWGHDLFCIQVARVTQLLIEVAEVLL